jgi:hypothetical protein
LILVNCPDHERLRPNQHWKTAKFGSSLRVGPGRRSIYCRFNDAECGLQYERQRDLMRVSAGKRLETTCKLTRSIGCSAAYHDLASDPELTFKRERLVTWIA